MKEKDENEEPKGIQPIPGQMCYDELLVPPPPEEPPQADTSVAAGQMDFWSLQKTETGVENAAEFKKILTTQKQEKQTKQTKQKVDKQVAEQENDGEKLTEQNVDDLFSENNAEETEQNNTEQVFEENFDEQVSEQIEDDDMSDKFEEIKMNFMDDERQNSADKAGKNSAANSAGKAAGKDAANSAKIGANSAENAENAVGDVEASEQIAEQAHLKAEKFGDSDNSGGGNSVGGYYGGNGILFKPLEEVLHDSMIPYTEHVVLDRALPRVEDGLKPVQRRILYSMLELGLTPDKPYRKSARIVGDCMGKYHPHGDISVYDAMVRMSQDFVLRAPLVDGHGNFGSVDGDSAAAMRYTEARMTPLAMELLRDLEKDTVRWGLNFDDTLKEPDVLPGRFPNLLVNGTSGIAVGVATNIPPHNLGEVIDGVVAYIDNPNITLDQMMKIIKGPDFPTGGELIYGDGLRSAYETGKGKIIIRAKVGIEQNGDKQSLVITELPYQVNKAQLLQKIAELKEKNKDKLSVISEIRDESDRNGMRAVIRLKKEANAKKILGMLFQSTNLQVGYTINMVAIAGGKPKLLSLMDIISYYTAFQRDVVVRRTKFDLAVAKDRAHIVEGLLIAIKNIDEVIKIIKTSANVAEAKQRLRSKFALSEKQAQAILDMRLARLVNLEVNKLQEELAALKARISELEAILNSKKLQLDVVKREILEIKRKFNTPRRSKESKDEEIKLAKIEEMEDTKDYLIALSAGKTLKKVNMKNYSKSNKILSENSTLFDIHTQILPVKPTDAVLIFTDKGNCLKIQVDKLPECKWREKGITLKNIDKTIDIMETPTAVLRVQGEGDVVMFTQKGMVKRTAEKDLVVAKSFYQVIKLADDDKLIAVENEVKGKTLVMMSKNGMCVNFEKSEVPMQGRVAGGVKGMNLDGGDSVIFAGQNMGADFLIVSANGRVKKLAAAQVPICARYRKGVKYVGFEGGCKQVAYVGTKGSAVVDQGLKFALLEGEKFKTTNDRLSTGTEEIKKKFLGVYDFES